MEEANEKRLIIVKQLPEFEEHLHLIKEEAEKRVADAMQMVVSEETVKTVKKVRAELNSEFSALEQSRIAAKKAVMEPYEKLEAIYKTCVTDVYGPANEQLGSKIADVENGLKEAKKEKIKSYFEECCVAANIDWLKYEQAEITVTLSASEKSLKEKAKSFVSRIASEIGLIETQEHADEIMVEYKQTLLLADSIRLIQRRYEALQKEKEKKERIAYKAFGPGLVCRNYQFEKGRNVTDKAKCAAGGFHCAEDPLDCLCYYQWNGKNEFWIVEAGGDIDEDGVDTSLTRKEKPSTGKVSTDGKKNARSM